MSIIFIDDILFNDNGEERTIRYGNCILFLILNGISILSGLIYLYFYFIIPYYQNSSNSLSLYLSIFHLITNIFYFLVFFDFYLYKLEKLSFTIKIITMFNPLIIFCIYYWAVCLTHNLYVTYYNYIHNINKRIKFYKYLLFLISLIFYIFILLNIHYSEYQVISKNFYLITNYNKSFIDFFYICGLIMIVYIIIKLYYVLNKKEDFISINEYQESHERNEKIKNIFNSVINRNISFIIYFLVTFTPTNIAMIFRYILSYTNFQVYFIDFMTVLLICFSGTFILCLRLLDPLMRRFLINLLLFNREFITKYKEHILKEKQLNESFISNSFNETFLYNESSSDNKLKVVRNYKKSKTIMESPTSFTFGKIKSAASKEIRNFGTSSKLNRNGSSSEKFEMNNLNNDNISDLNELEEYYYNEGQDNIEDNKSKNTDNTNNYSQKLGFSSNNSIEINKKEKEEEKKEEEKKEEEKKEDKERNNSKNSKVKSNEHLNSFGSNDKKSSYNKNFSKFRNMTIVSQKSLGDSEHKTSKYSLRSRFRGSFRKKRDIKTLLNNRANSTASGIFQKKTSLGFHKKRSNSKLNEVIFHEEISSFALMNYHLEMNDNLTRLIAISIAINECRIYDDIKGYKKYYNSTIPWDNKDFYKERTLFKEYNEKTIPSWIGIKKEARFNNIQFKILSFCPFVFHHIRLMDNISIDDILSSLDPINNMKKIKSMKVTGGRGNNCIINTWDKKIIVKTVNKNERQILVEKMIVDYHCLMKESKSLLSRIYGIFKIELKDKGSINVMIQRNMNDLPIKTKLLTFDFKGSTVDRQSISEEDIKLNKQELVNKYKNKVLKDIDLGIIDMKFVIDYNNWQKIMSVIDSDSMFLQNYEVTDYSLLIFVHKYRKEDLINNKNCSRIIPSKDNKYIFNFSIVDFLGPFNFEKKGEKLAKELVGYIKKLKDTNFSVLDPNRYGTRFRNFAKKIIIDG
mgnify:CR=1 FL=1